MLATGVLREEHRVIEVVLNCLECLADQAERGNAFDRESAADALEFFRTFADRCHHHKEEAHLFPMMEAKGFSATHGPTSVMRAEHETGRELLHAMEEAIRGRQMGMAGGTNAFARFSRAYGTLLREHIRKEEECLFAMADASFSEEDQRTLLSSFQHVESYDLHAGTHAEYLSRARGLAERLGVLWPAIEATGPRCGCDCHAHTDRQLSGNS
jgi:hemerythrin-like domain-containing protein